MGKSGIYAIRCTANGKIYVGSTTNFTKRWSRHRMSLSRGNHHSVALQSAWNKYGGDNFVFEVLEIVADTADLIRIEQEWLDRTRASQRRHGYNIFPTATGSPLGRKLSPEHKAKISAANRGRAVSPETGDRISASKKGSSPSAETREKIRATLSGRPISPETRAKMSDARMGNTNCKGHRQSPASIAKRSASLRGRKHTDEARAKMSAACRARAAIMRAPPPDC